MPVQQPPPPSAPEILLVDDDLELRAAIADVLTEQGLRVHEAGNGQEALTLLRAAARPQLILLDLMMPVMNGWQFCEIVRSDPELGTIPVVALSAAARRDPASPYYVAVDAVVPKPVDLDELVAIVERFVPAWPKTLGGAA